ncbi:MAG: signal peptidase I, partial [Armatimonadaceae bacterium]
MNDQVQTPITDQIANLPLPVIIAVIAGATFFRFIFRKVDNSFIRGICDLCDTCAFVLALAFLIIRPFVAQAFYIPTESMVNTLLVNDRLVVDRISYRLGNPKRGDIIVFDAPPTATNGKKLDFIKRCVAIEGDTVEVQPPKVMAGDREIDAIAMTGMDWHRVLREVLTTQEGSVKFLESGVSIDAGAPMSIADFQAHLKDKLQAYAKANGPSLTVTMAQQLIDAGKDLTIIPGRLILNGKPVQEAYTREDPDYVLPTLTIGKDEVFMLGDNRNFSHDSHMWGALETKRIVGKAQAIWFPLNRLQLLRRP